MVGVRGWLGSGVGLVGVGVVGIRGGQGCWGLGLGFLGAIR